MSHPESTIYNIPLLIELDDGIETDRLVKALAAAVNAHPYMNTRLFMDNNGDIRQRRNDGERFSAEDIERITADTLDEIRETLVRPFRLLEERLFRIKVIQAEKNYLYLELHHIVSDGTSALILLDDVSAAYGGAALHPEGYSAYEVSLTEEKARAGTDYERAEAYYQKLLGGCDTECLPAGDLRKTQKAQPGSITRYGEYADAEAVKSFCETNKLSLNGFFTAAFGLVLSKYSGKETSVFTTIYNGRNDSRLERTVAMLVKTFPVLCEVTGKAGGHTVTEYVSKTGMQLLDSMSNDLYSFGEISRQFGVSADVMFAYQGESFSFDRLCGKPARLLDLRLDQVKAPLNLNVYLENGKIRCFLEYRCDQFSRAYAEGFLDAFDMAVSEMLKKRTLREISILSDKARQEMARFNDTKGMVEPLAAPALLERQVNLHPERLAVTAGKVRLTFAELNARANRIAHSLISRGVGRSYIGLAEQTKAKFITCQGEKAYKSGDIAYWDADGKIVHCGRSDNQVKLRGLRVELDEIENVMNRFGEIKRSVVLVKGEGSEQYLCGYYAADRPVDPEALKGFMKKYLTEYMIPSVFVYLTVMPMTHNGKVDKRVLPEPVPAEEKRTGRAPANGLERKFCEIFAMALGRESIFADDDFFLLGGTSLSASKIAMRCMTEKINVVYSDVFEYSTPGKMAAYVSGMRSVKETAAAPAAAKQAGEREPLYEVLQYNTTAHVKEISRGDIGSVLVSGATGFLGIHVVRTLLKTDCRKIYCLVRKGRQQSSEERLKMMLMYYFDDTFDGAFDGRLIPVDGDITDGNLKDRLADCDFDTVINCAACVKHFVRDDLLDRVNVRGVENLIGICMDRGKRLVQVSTVSIAGESVDNHIPEEFKLTENKLSFGQNLDNKYAETKFRAEKAVLEAVQKGLRGKIVRVGNLMGRESDGEFQINYSTNGFMKRLRAYSIIGCYPVGSLDAVAEFSPIDSTAEALVALAGTPDRFTVFHAYNCHHVHMANVLDAMAQNGMQIETVGDAEFEARFQQMLRDESRNMEISGLIAYMNSGETNRRYVGWDNSFTVKALYRLGFSWPLTAERYMDRAVKALSTLGFFDEKET